MCSHLRGLASLRPSLGCSDAILVCLLLSSAQASCTVLWWWWLIFVSLCAVPGMVARVRTSRGWTCCHPTGSTPVTTTPRWTRWCWFTATRESRTSSQSASSETVSLLSPPISIERKVLLYEKALISGRQITFPTSMTFRKYNLYVQKVTKRFGTSP